MKIGRRVEVEMVGDEVVGSVGDGAAGMDGSVDMGAVEVVGD